MAVKVNLSFDRDSVNELARLHFEQFQSATPAVYHVPKWDELPQTIRDAYVRALNFVLNYRLFG